MTEDHCRRRAEHLMGAMASAQGEENRRRLIEQAMRWHNRAMIAHDRELLTAASTAEPESPPAPSASH